MRKIEVLQGCYQLPLADATPLGLISFSHPPSQGSPACRVTTLGFGTQCRWHCRWNAQRDSVPKPRVGASRLPWGGRPHPRIHNPTGVASGGRVGRIQEGGLRIFRWIGKSPPKGTTNSWGGVMGWDTPDGYQSMHFTILTRFGYFPVSFDIYSGNVPVSGEEIRDFFGGHEHQRGGPDFRQRGGARRSPRCGGTGRRAWHPAPPGWTMWLPWMPVPEALSDWLVR